MHPEAAALLIQCMGYPIVIGLSGIVIWDTWRKLTGKRSFFFDRSITPPKPAPRVHRTVPGICWCGGYHPETVSASEGKPPPAPKR